MCTEMNGTGRDVPIWIRLVYGKYYGLLFKSLKLKTEYQTVETVNCWVTNSIIIFCASPPVYHRRKIYGMLPIGHQKPPAGLSPFLWSFNLNSQFHRFYILKALSEIIGRLESNFNLKSSGHFTVIQFNSTKKLA